MFVLPKKVIQRLRTGEGKRILLIEAPDGAFQFAPSDAELEE